jgi:ParB family chromosome partitioning protein
MVEAPPKTTNPAYIMAEVARIKVGNLHRKDYGDLPGLAGSMAVVGQLQPIGLNRNNELLWGLRRLKSAEILEWGRIAAVVVDCDQQDATLVEYHENFCRKDFTISEKVKIGKAMEAVVGNRQGQRTDKGGEQLPRKCGEVQPGQETADAAANVAGFGSADTYSRAKAVAESGNTALISLVDDGKVSVAMGAQAAKLPQDAQRQFVAAVIGGKSAAAALKAALPQDDALHVNQIVQQWVADGTLKGAAKDEVLNLGGAVNAQREEKQSQYVRRRKSGLDHDAALASVHHGGKRATDKERQEAKEKALEAIGTLLIQFARLGLVTECDGLIQQLSAKVKAA